MGVADAMQKQTLFPLIVFLVLWSGCSSVPEVASRSVTKNITIDGNDDDWPAGLTPIEDLKSSVGFQNDNDHLFVCLRTVDHAAEMQILRGGLTVWLDSTGGKERTFGIRFPLELKSVAGAEGGPEGNPEERLERFLSQPMMECELLGADKTDRQRVPVSSATGIDAHLGFHHGVLIYELMVPLTHGNAGGHALHWGTSARIGVGFETQLSARPEFQRRPEQDSGNEDGEEGSRGERGPRERGRQGWGGGRGSTAVRPEPVSGWVTATLASGQ